MSGHRFEWRRWPEEAYALIDYSCERILELRRDHKPRAKGAGRLNKGIIHCQEICLALGKPPPRSMIELDAHQHGVKLPTHNRRKYPKAYFHMVEYVAHHPDATPSAIRRAVGPDNLDNIRRICAETEFRLLVAEERRRLKNNKGGMPNKFASPHMGPSKEVAAPPTERRKCQNESSANSSPSKNSLAS